MVQQIRLKSFNRKSFSSSYHCFIAMIRCKRIESLIHIETESEQRSIKKDSKKISPIWIKAIPFHPPTFRWLRPFCTEKNDDECELRVTVKEFEKISHKSRRIGSIKKSIKLYCLSLLEILLNSARGLNSHKRSEIRVVRLCNEAFFLAAIALRWDFFTNSGLNHSHGRTF